MFSKSNGNVMHSEHVFHYKNVVTWAHVVKESDIQTANNIWAPVMIKKLVTIPLT